MTPDDAKRMAARIGITDLTPDDLTRLAALTANAEAAVAQLPVLPKSAAPALVFTVAAPKP